MNETETMSQDEFFEAFAGEDGYQTDTAEEIEETVTEETETEQTSEETTQGGEEEAESDETPEGKEAPTEEKPAAESDQAAETFTIKVNKEERQVSREEMITLAQKGADYDRVKAAVEQAKSDNTALKEQNAKMQEAYDLLDTLAGESKITVPELLRVFRVNRLKGQGLSEDAARERVAREDAERELQTLKAQQQKAAQPKPGGDRAKREVEEFRKTYPDVQITEALVDSLMDDVRAGMTMTQAYQKQEAAKKDEEIRRLTAELEAERKNKENRASSPGSQKDGGAKRAKTQFDAFFASFDD